MAVRYAIAFLCAAYLTASPPAFAQQSASFRAEEYVRNAGGTPQNGASAASASFRITLSSLGDGLALGGLSSASFRADGSFVAAYPPPGEVEGLLLQDSQTLVWSPEPSVGTYNVYRGTVAAGHYGVCLLPDVAASGASDAAVPAGGGAFLYLVTAENRLREEGTKGSTSAGVQRGGAVCP